MLSGTESLALVLPWICIRIFSRSRGATAVRDLQRNAENADDHLLDCAVPNEAPVQELLRPWAACAHHDACQPHGR